MDYYDKFNALFNLIRLDNILNELNDGELSAGIL